MTVGHENIWTYQIVVPRSIRSIAVSPRVETILGFLAFEIAYYFAFAIGISFRPAPASPFWFPDAVLLCALLKSRRELWWLFILGTLPIRLFTDTATDIPFWYKAAAFGIDSVEQLVTALLLRRLVRNELGIDTLRDIVVFIALCVHILQLLY